MSTTRQTVPVYFWAEDGSTVNFIKAEYDGDAAKPDPYANTYYEVSSEGDVAHKNNPLYNEELYREICEQALHNLRSVKESVPYKREVGRFKGLIASASIGPRGKRIPVDTMTSEVEFDITGRSPLKIQFIHSSVEGGPAILTECSEVFREQTKFCAPPAPELHRAA